jgi:hypothetical protein
VKFIRHIDGPWLEINPERWLPTFVVAWVRVDQKAIAILKIEKK